MRIPNAVPALAMSAFLILGTTSCESESDGPEAQPAEGIREVPVTEGGQTPHVADPHVADVPGDMPGDTAPAADDETPYP